MPYPKSGVGSAHIYRYMEHLLMIPINSFADSSCAPPWLEIYTKLLVTKFPMGATPSKGGGKMPLPPLNETLIAEQEVRQLILQYRPQI